MPGKADGDESLPENAKNASLSAARLRRQPKLKPDKFERIRQAREKNEKVKVVIEPVKNVYDMVDEEEYCRIVSERQLNDFVETDGAHTEYVDTGGEIFDDELDDESLANIRRIQNQKNGKGKRKAIKRLDVGGRQQQKTSGDLRDFFSRQPISSKPKIELTTTALTDATIVEDLLEELNSDPVSETPKPDSRTGFFLGSGKTVENVLAECYDDSLFSKTSLRKKKSSQPDIRPPSPKRFLQLNVDFDETTLSCSPPRNAKRVLQESPAKSPPIKKETLEEARQNISAPKIKKFVELKSKATVAAEVAQAKRMRAGTSPKKGTRVEWADDNFDDFSNTSYEVDSVLDTEDMYAQMASMVLPDDIEEGVKFTPRAQLPKIEQKWMNMDQKLLKSDDTQVEMDSQLAEVTSGGSLNSLRIYWLDAYEDPHHQPGCVFLFGKMLDRDGKTFVSVCVKIISIQRKLYFLKRDTRLDLDGENDADEEVTFQDLVEEYEGLDICKKLHVKRFREQKKKYAFEKLDVPNEGVYLEARMPFTAPVLTKDFGETFSHVFGRNTSALEIFLLELKLKGPRWLNIQNAVASNPRFSWCKEEFNVEYHSAGACNLSIVEESRKDPHPPPPMVIMGIQLRIVVNAKTKQNEIVAASILTHRNFPLDKAAPASLFDEHHMIITYPQELGSSMSRQCREAVKTWKDYNLQVVGKEQDLINVLLHKIMCTDPDFLVFHDALGYQLDILLQRAMQLNVTKWSYLGRLKRSIPPKGRTASQQACTGRLLCDIRRAAEELIHSKSYDLTELVRVILKDESHQAIPNDLIKEMFKDPERLRGLVDNTLYDGLFILRIMAELNVLPLALEMTRTCGNVLSRTLLGGRSERIEYHLLHAFYEADYICPDKEYRDSQHNKDGKGHAKKKKKKSVVEGKEVSKAEEVDQETVNGEDEHLAEEENDALLHDEVAAPTKATGGKRKPAFSGGLVLEPKRGLYDTPILVMDFNSLYPSIILEYNVCYTTVDRKSQNNLADDNLPAMPDASAKPGILPQVISRLVEQRKLVKRMLKDNNSDDRKAQLEIRQKALKLIANSTYGCLGFDHSRFRAKGLAALITSKGREILMSTKELIEKDRREVIYGDTDSIMINSHVTAESPGEKFSEVLKLGTKIKQEVNKHYKFLELDIDGIFFSMLLLQKKKYAALVASRNVDGSIVTKQELKGLDIVRRDWSIIAIETGSLVVQEILSGKKRDEMVSGILTVLGNVARFVKECPPTPNESDLKKFIILKQLTKDPNLYADAKAHPHVQIARRLNSLTTTSQKCRAGDMIAYVVCNEVPSDVVVTGKRAPHTQRGYAAKEVLDAQGALTIDKQYYLAEQVHKVVNRLCEPIEGVDSSTMADCLGIDKNLFPGHFVDRTADDDLNTLGSVVPDIELYKDCLPLRIVCPNCQENWMFDGPVWEKDGNYSFSLQKCLSCEQRPVSFLTLLQNTLRMQLNVAMQRYYKVQFTCEDPACHYKCGYIPPKFSRGKPVCPACDNGRTFRIMKPEYSDRDLYLQLCYWKNAFDPERALNKMKNKSAFGPLMDTLKSDVGLTATYQHLAKYIQTFLDQSAYGRVNFCDFFSPAASSVDIRPIKIES